MADWQTALFIAYPTLRFDDDSSTLLTEEGVIVPAADPTGRKPSDLLNDPTLGDQFAYLYDLSNALTARETAFHDAGRIRNEAFFKALYFADAASAQAGMVTVSAGAIGPSQFQVTEKHGVACQLQAALAALATGPAELAPFFTSVGGGFNWRRIAGTNRLSPHSFGIAFDINAQLGQYWKWSGAPEGQVGQYDNKLPWRLVETMERFGFIWGGKWHHFDGMHFEYRPELIVFSRFQRAN